MKSHDQITILRNRHRARELRIFRDLVAEYFARSEPDPDDVPADWEGAQAARSRINQMLPRVIRIVRAAGLGGSTGAGPTTDPGLPLGRVDVLQRIFTTRYGDGADQEIFDVLDMALGVYDGDRVTAMVRTVNPFYWAGAALAFVARAPGWLLGTLGLRRRAQPRIRAEDIARLEAAAARLGDIEELIEARFVSLRDRQALKHAEHTRQVAELAERLDFAERVLARERPLDRIAPPKKSGVTTPV